MTTIYRISSSGIVMDLEENQHFRFGPATGSSPVVDAWAEVTVNGVTLDSFDVLPETPQAEEIETELGMAQRHTIAGTVNLPDGGKLQRDLKVETYPQWPGSLLVHCGYTNQSERPVVLDRVADPVILCDSSRVDAANAPHAFWSLQTISTEWGQDFAFPLSPDFSRDNYLGHVDGGDSGGVPLVYLWNRQMGVGLAHIETEPREWYMPVAVQKSAGVRMALENRNGVALAPGESWDGLKALISVHQGDFYDFAARYSSIMAASGMPPAQPNPEDYEPVWCSWGYDIDITPAKMLGVIPKLHEFGIRWATLDYRWFDCYGDYNPRADTFPGGEEQMRAMVDALHEAGIKVQLWWIPLAVENGETGQTARIVQEHPDWLCRHKDGRLAHNHRGLTTLDPDRWSDEGLAMLDPAIPGVQDYIVELTRRFVEDWGFDGHKLDNVYFMPACYGSTYHDRPEDPLAAFGKVFGLVHDTTRQLKPASVTQVCPCGTPPAYNLLPHFDQPVTADPTSSQQVRRRVKFYKAIYGPDAPVFADHVELSDDGIDFASAVGTGAVPGTKFVWPETEPTTPPLEGWHGLNPEKEVRWAEWLKRYNQYRLSEGEFLNVYDLAYDVPESYVIRRGSRLYFAFFTLHLTDSFEGVVEFRGLTENTRYALTDYVAGRDLGRVTGPYASLTVAFSGSLLVEAAPAID